MSVARGLGQNGGRLYSNITKPVKVDLSWVVDPANANGLGVSSLKSNGYVRNVFMHTAGAPGSNNGATNPNPANGFALIQFNNNFNFYLNSVCGLVPPVTGAAIIVTAAGAALVVGNAYVIFSLGTTTTAQWHSLGVPAGVTPAVGVSFIALLTGIGVGTGTVKFAGVSGIAEIEVVGNPNVMNNVANIDPNGGAYLMLQFLGATGAALTALIPTAPLALSIVNMSAFYDGSSVTIDGL